MHTSTGIRERIDYVYPSLRPAERAVAQYVRDHLDEAAELTVGQMAKVTHVSEPTVIRFSRKLGFGGYREMRYVLRHPHTDRQAVFDPLQEFDLNPWDKLDDVPGKTVAATKTLLNDLLTSLDRNELHKAVSLIAQAHLIDIVGTGNSLTPATDLFTKLSCLGLTCRLNADTSMQQIGAGHLTENDIAIAFSYSGQSSSTIQALRLAKSRRAHTITVTSAPDAPIGIWTDVHLLVGRGEHAIQSSAMFSRCSYTAMVDILYIGVILSDYGRFAAEFDHCDRYIQDCGSIS